MAITSHLRPDGWAWCTDRPGACARIAVVTVIRTTATKWVILMSTSTIRVDSFEGCQEGLQDS